MPTNRRNRLKPRRGRPCSPDEETYKRMRRCVERFFPNGSVQEACLRVGEAGVNLLRTHTTSMHNNTLEGFEMVHGKH